jgi:hypothetical protein
MIDVYSAHIIAREENEAYKESRQSHYSESVGPREPGWMFMQIGRLLTSFGSALTVLEIRLGDRERRSVEEQPQGKLEQQPCLEC